MRCFNHSDRDANGICRACGRGLCKECAVDLGFGLACRGDHEKRVAANEQIVTRGAQVQEAAAWARYFGPAFFGFCGLVMIYFGLTTREMSGFLALLGAAFAGFGVFLFIAQRKAFRKKGNAKPTT